MSMWVGTSECAECRSPFLSSDDYICPDCRSKEEGKSHPMVGLTIESVVDHDDMRGIVLHFSDGTQFQALYRSFK